jgi:hypothetical protein
MGDVRDFLFENLAGLVQAVPVDDGIAVVGEKTGRGREVVFAISFVNFDS